MLIATAAQLNKVFERNSTIDIPEQRLFFSVIAQAVSDLKNEKGENRLSAQRFIRSRDFDGYCAAVSLNAEWARKELIKHAGL